MLFDFVEESYRAVATKTLVKRLDAELDAEEAQPADTGTGAPASDSVTIPSNRGSGAARRRTCARPYRGPTTIR